MTTCIQLYTVPDRFPTTRLAKLVLKSADGIVFVAASQDDMMEANVASLRIGRQPQGQGCASRRPYVLQFNKPRSIHLAFRRPHERPHQREASTRHESVATTGVGVQDTQGHRQARPDGDRSEVRLEAAAV